MCSSVFSPCFFTVTRNGGPLFTEADGGKLGRIDTQADQVSLHAVGTPLPQRDVILISAAFITVALDDHVPLRIIHQPGGVLRKGRLCLRAQGKIIEIKGRIKSTFS